MESSASAGRVAPAVLDPRRWWALVSEQDLQWVLSAYALTFGGLLLLGGRAADLLGRRRVFMAGVVFFTTASLVCGLAWSPAQRS